jgi:hypothetical protein
MRIPAARRKAERLEDALNLAKQRLEESSMLAAFQSRRGNSNQYHVARPG